MGLSSELISQFVKITKDNKKTSNETTVYGTVVYDGKPYVKLDGSDLLTPISTTADVTDGERVTVMIKNHTATVTGNMSSPAARTDDVKDIANEISEFEIVMAYKVTTEDLEAINATIESLRGKVANFENLEAFNAEIENLEAKFANLEYVNAEDLEAITANIESLQATFGQFTDISTEELEALNAEITNLKGYTADFTYVSADVLDAMKASIKNLEVEKLSAKDADFKYASIERLDATLAEIDKIEADYGEFKKLTVDNFTATDAAIDDLNATKLSAKDIEGKYANIDFSNIGEAAIEKFFAKSGLIEDIVVGDGTITGHLVGVTISGDLIEGNTIKAEKLVVKGEDGLYYKLNIEGGVTSSETVTDEQLQNGLHGSVIIAHSITAEQISVKDLVAFDATIGGFNITENSLYSGVKESVDNTTEGVYLDNEGQLAVGDANNFIKYYKAPDGTYKLEISADSITFGSSKKTIEEIEVNVNNALGIIDNINQKVESGELAGESATVLRIDSSRGTVFKNSAVSTVLSAVIYKGSKRIVDIADLRSEYGEGAYLEWSWQRLGENSFGTIVSTDSRIGQDGFTFTLSPEDVDTKVVFMCQLVTD